MSTPPRIVVDYMLDAAIHCKKYKSYIVEIEQADMIYGRAFAINMITIKASVSGLRECVECLTSAYHIADDILSDQPVQIDKAEPLLHFGVPCAIHHLTGKCVCLLE